MKLKKLSLFFILPILFIGMSVYYSCSKDDQELVDIKEDYKIENGIIFFKDLKSFTKTINQLHKNGRDNLKTWEAEIGFENSLRKFYEDTVVVESEINEVLETNSWELVPDPYLASVVNKEGIYVVGDTIHKITYDVEYLITDGDFKKLESIDNGLKSSGTIIEFQIKR